MPSDATNLRDLLHIDKIYGNVIDGISIPGVRLKADGTIRYEGDSMLAQANYQTNTQTYQRSLSFIDQAWRARDSQDAYGMHDSSYAIEVNNHVLAGGVNATSTIVGASAGNKIACSWVALSWDTDPAAAYVLQFFEEDTPGTIFWELRWTPSEIGERKFVMTDTGTDNKGLFAAVSGGAGAENLYSRANFTYF